MPAIHRLKTERRFFAAIGRGDKTFDVRFDGDRGFQAGDTVIFEEVPNKSDIVESAFPPFAAPPTTPAIHECMITYVLHSPMLQADHVVFGIRPA